MMTPKDYEYLKVFRVLKEIGVELSSYHGGSLNGKDIKKVMNNATHLFDTFASHCAACPLVV